MSRSLGRLGRLLALGLLASMLCVATPAAGKQAIGLSSGKFEFSAAVGQKGSGQVVVINDGDEPIRVLVYAANQVVSDTGEVTYQIPSRDDPGVGFNPANWMSIATPTSNQTIGNTPMIPLEPGENAPVDFSFTVPEGVPPGDHQIILFFEMMADETEMPETGARVVGRVGARLTVRVQGEVIERLEVRPFVLRSVIVGTKSPYTFVMRNSGNVDEDVSVRLLMLDGRGNEVSSSTLVTETVVYAGTNSEYQGIVEPDVSLGRYTARLVVDYDREAGGGASLPDQAIAELTVWVVPLWLAIASVGVLGLLLVYLSWRRAVAVSRRRAQEQRERRRAQRDATRTVSADAAVPRGEE